MEDCGKGLHTVVFEGLGIRETEEHALGCACAAAYM